ncbi:MAG: hypothetical protein JKY54_16060 [Flavobacteriales bacterium]|nr:hypothetical protein [Flavobacteriales bacterium]
MKNYYYGFILFIGIAILSGCAKYEEGPGFSLLSKKSRLANTWVFDKITHTHTDSNGSDTNEEQSVVGSDYEIEFEKGGTFIINNDGLTLPGTWEFTGDTELLMTFDSDPATVYTTTILKLKNKDLWTRTTTSYEVSGEMITTVSITHHVPK